MPVRKNITFITCTHTSGYTRLKVTTQPTSIVRRRGRVIHSQPRLHTAAGATGTRLRVTRFSTVTSPHFAQAGFHEGADKRSGGWRSGNSGLQCHTGTGDPRSHAPSGRSPA